MMQCLQRLLKEMGTVSAQTSVKRMKTSQQPSGNSMLVKAKSQNIRNHNPKSKNTITAIECCKKITYIHTVYTVLFFNYVQNYRFALTIASLSLRPLDEGPRSSVFAKAKEE